MTERGPGWFHREGIKMSGLFWSINASRSVKFPLKPPYIGVVDSR